MRTIMVIGMGLVALSLFALVGRKLGGTASAAKAAKAALWFLPLWAAAAAWNLSIGVRHGYSAGEELPIALVVFAVPAAVAVFLWRKFSTRV